LIYSSSVSAGSALARVGRGGFAPLFHGPGVFGLGQRAFAAPASGGVLAQQRERERGVFLL